MMDELLMFIRFSLHMTTFAFLVSYRTQETSRPWVSLAAATIAGLSLASAAHIVLMRPECGHFPAIIIALACCAAVVRSRGNLAKVFK